MHLLVVFIVCFPVMIFVYLGVLYTEEHVRRPAIWGEK